MFISSVPPFLLKTADNPEGVDASVFEGIEKAINTDRYAFFTEFFKNFFNTDVLGKRERTSRAIQLERRGSRFCHGHPRVRADMAYGFPQGLAAR